MNAAEFLQSVLRVAADYQTALDEGTYKEEGTWFYDLSIDLTTLAEKAEKLSDGAPSS